MNNKLWEQSTKLHPLIESYTVNKDHLYDTKLLPYDLQGSLAHAKMLSKIGILNKHELEEITQALAEVKALHEEGKFDIKPEQEDCHTAIEQYITKKHGDVGKKIHTGRSRNDQAMTMLRLYMKDELNQCAGLLAAVAKQYDVQASKTKGMLMPGYTHMQKAMPTTADSWFGAYQDAFEDLIPMTKSVVGLIDQNPLGSAAGFGVVGIDIDRTMTTRDLDFKKVQENPIYCGISRGLFELAVVQHITLIAILCGKFASDMMLFTTQEFDYFSLPDEYTTGSSIMPNKHNYDLFEIMRGNAGMTAGYQNQIQNVLSGLGSGFHRDLQLTKAPLVESFEITISTLKVLEEVVPKINIHKDKLASAMSEDLFATEEVYKLVKEGLSFREAYKKVKRSL